MAFSSSFTIPIAYFAAGDSDTFSESMELKTIVSPSSTDAFSSSFFLTLTSDRFADSTISLEPVAFGTVVSSATGTPTASSNYAISNPVVPGDNNIRAGSNYSISNFILPLGQIRASSNYSLTIDYNVDAENTVQFGTVADATVMTPSEVFADADNTVQFNTIASEEAQFTVNAQNTAQFNAVADEIGELQLDAANTVQFNTTDTTLVNKQYAVSADNTIQFDDEIFTASEIIVDASNTLRFAPSVFVPPDIDRTNIIIHGAEYHQKDNISGPQGGCVEYSKKIMLGPVPILSQIQFMSQSPNDDNQVYMVEGIGENRLIESELVQLNGLEVVHTSKPFRRLCKIEKINGDPITGIVTVCVGTNIIGMMTPNEGTDCPETTTLINFLPNAMGRANVDTAFYEKFFIKNKTGRTINVLTVKEHQSDFDEHILFASDPSFDDCSTSRNRLTKPGNIIPGQFLTDTPIVVNNVPNGASIGIWLRIVIPAGEGTVLNTWKIKIDADGTELILDLLHREAFGETGALTFSKRNLHPIGGGNPLRYVELGGARFVQQIYYEPDPVTFRDQFYYNARLNRLFKKIDTKPNPVWKLVR